MDRTPQKITEHRGKADTSPCSTENKTNDVGRVRGAATC